VFGAACDAVAGQAETGYLAELGEIGSHLMFVETVGDASAPISNYDTQW
jgi:hypothetical protein